MTTSIRRTQVERQLEHDKAILSYHVGSNPAGLKCPVCGRWSPLAFDSPQGVRLDCHFGDYGAVAILPRVQLARAIRNHHDEKAITRALKA